MQQTTLDGYLFVSRQVNRLNGAKKRLVPRPGSFELVYRFGLFSAMAYLAGIACALVFSAYSSSVLGMYAIADAGIAIGLAPWCAWYLVYKCVPDKAWQRVLDGLVSVLYRSRLKKIDAEVRYDLYEFRQHGIIEDMKNDPVWRQVGLDAERITSS